MVRLPVFSWQVLELNTLNTRRFLLRLPELLSRWRRERTFSILPLKIEIRLRSPLSGDQELLS
jgi:hypothetical protein